MWYVYRHTNSHSARYGCQTREFMKAFFPDGVLSPNETIDFAQYYPLFVEPKNNDARPSPEAWAEWAFKAKEMYDAVLR